MKRYVAIFGALLLAIAWSFSTIKPADAGYVEPYRGIVILCNTNTPPACQRWQTQQTFRSRGECFAFTQTEAERIVNRTLLERPGYRFTAGVRCVVEPTA